MSFKKSTSYPSYFQMPCSSSKSLYCILGSVSCGNNSTINQIMPHNTGTDYKEIRKRSNQNRRHYQFSTDYYYTVVYAPVLQREIMRCLSYPSPESWRSSCSSSASPGSDGPHGHKTTSSSTHYHLVRTPQHSTTLTDKDSAYI